MSTEPFVRFPANLMPDVAQHSAWVARIAAVAIYTYDCDLPKAIAACERDGNAWEEPAADGPVMNPHYVAAQALRELQAVVLTAGQQKGGPDVG